MKKILYYSILNFQPESLDLLYKNFKVIELPDPDHDSEDILREIVALFAPLGFYCGREKIDLCPKLKVIASNTTGVPHIDIDYAEKKGISIAALHTEKEFLKTITATAEHTWGLLLALTRRIPWAFDSVKEGIWDRRLFPGKAMLSSMTLGIIGLGRIGSMVARYGRNFGMKVQYYDPYVKSDHEKEIECVKSLATLVSENDIISVHIPHNETTENLINRVIFNSFKKGAYFINTSRAEIMDSTALLEALENQRLGGAAIDVFKGEYQKGFSGSDFFREHPLVQYARTHDNLLMSPHIGGSTSDAWGKTECYTIEKLLKNLNISP